MLSWFNGLNPSQPTTVTKTFGKKPKCAPTKAKGEALVEAPPGALARRIKIGNKTNKSGLPVPQAIYRQTLRQPFPGFRQDGSNQKQI